jgi:hypothetical protein
LFIDWLNIIKGDEVMRINEIANAQEQLALWRLISDTIWQVFDQQQAEPSTTARVYSARPTTSQTPSRPATTQSEKNRVVAAPLKPTLSKSKRAVAKTQRPAFVPKPPTPKLAKPILPLSVKNAIPKSSSLLPIKPISPITSINSNKRELPNATKNSSSVTRDALTALNMATKEKQK